jgi:uncharacterized protein (DUF1697 family)
MNRLIVLLRGINVGSSRRIAMADLRAMLTDLGYEDPRTLLQSGNVVLSTKESPKRAGARIEQALERTTGHDVKVIVRTRDEIAQVLRRNPLRKVATAPKWYLVVFLSAAPTKAALAKVDPAEFEPERFAADGREVYVWFPSGMQRAKLNHAFWEKQLGVTATGRNWNTVEKLLELADE